MLPKKVTLTLLLLSCFSTLAVSQRRYIYNGPPVKPLPLSVISRGAYYRQAKQAPPPTTSITFPEVTDDLFDLGTVAADEVSSQQSRSCLSKEENLEKLYSSSQEFELALFSQFSDRFTPSQKDFLISPFSLWSLLLLITSGADGNSLIQLEQTLRISDSNRDLLCAAFKNIQQSLSSNDIVGLQSIFTDINRPFEAAYKDSVKQCYSAKLAAVDFRDIVTAAQMINTEVQQSTRNMITQAVTPTDLTDVQMVLLSTLYFKGQWKYPFDKNRTQRKPFHNEDGQVIGEVDMMFRIHNFAYTGITDLEGHVLELPYINDSQNDDLSMVVILPRRSVSVGKIVKNLQKIGTKEVLRQLHNASVLYDYEDVEVNLPKFSITSDFLVNGVLFEMGIQDIFDPVKANLEKISSTAFVSRIFHNTKIIVDEEGAVAAAATTATLDNKSSPPKFNMNRPFVFMIVKKQTNTILFCGQVMNPTITNTTAAN